MANKIKKTTEKWRSKYRLVILNDHDFEEKLSLKLSRLNVFVIFTLGSIFLITATILLIAFTPLREYIPGYSSTALKRQAYQNALRVDSMEVKLAQYEQYVNILRGVITDEPPEYLDDSIEMRVTSAGNINLFPSAHDSMLRAEVEQEELFNIQQTSTTASQSLLSSYAFFAPVKGEISQPFLPEEGHFAVDIVTRTNEPVKACLKGTVLFSEFSAQTGYTIVLQHATNLISVYKHNSALFKKQGDVVRAGEVIGMVGSTGEFTTGPHLHFELWHEGKPVNPQDFIRF
ncbi:MAG: M23 family metallopeptidase [Cryomorphaceae bacterium]|nr:M23 family metallopeptidase [Cryomorphaceae bacterium]